MNFFNFLGYSTGLVILLNVENQQTITVLNVDSDISCLSWTQNVKDNSEEINEDHLNLLV